MVFDPPRGTKPLEKIVKHTAEDCIGSNIQPGPDEDIIKGQLIAFNNQDRKIQFFLEIQKELH